jgi:hypothetical protein
MCTKPGLPSGWLGSSLKKIVNSGVTRSATTAARGRL